MSNLQRQLTAALILGNVLAFSAVGTVRAQEPIKQVVQGQVKMCGQQEEYTIHQLIQLKQLHNQTHLTQQERFKAYLAILTPAQRQELLSCSQAGVKHAVMSAF
uniref:Uncharacterized protein n=1 Tax=Cyanothece sp. (strain PCC 7425 / ATCC 29141) TaxID=395961 RepID=B8HK42_CYAP4